MAPHIISKAPGAFAVDICIPLNPTIIMTLPIASTTDGHSNSFMQVGALKRTNLMLWPIRSGTLLGLEIACFNQKPYLR
jgi:hypothetical protein